MSLPLPVEQQVAHCPVQLPNWVMVAPPIKPAVLSSSPSFLLLVLAAIKELQNYFSSFPTVVNSRAGSSLNFPFPIGFGLTFTGSSRVSRIIVSATSLQILHGPSFWWLRIPPMESEKSETGKSSLSSLENLAVCLTPLSLLFLLYHASQFWSVIWFNCPLA
jgi:hypothetical protein